MSPRQAQPQRIAVLASGAGSNLAALIQATKDGRLPTTSIEFVASDRADAGALAVAKDAGLPAHHVAHPPSTRGGRAQHEAGIEELLANHGPIDLIVLAGYMRILSPDFTARYEGRLINTHPSLLPAFPGRDGPTETLAGGARIAGCTTHLVDAGIDTGAIILQAAVPVKADDDRDSLHRRIQRAEHLILPRTVGLFAEGRIHHAAGHVTIDPGPSWSTKHPCRDEEVLLPEHY